MCSRWIREQGGLPRRDADGTFDSCHLKQTQTRVKMYVTQSRSLSAHLFWQTSNNAGLPTMANVSYVSVPPHAVSALFSQDTQRHFWAHTLFCLGRLYIRLLPHFFEILYLSWERPFINILLIFACTAPLVTYLISGAAPCGRSQYTGS